MKYVYNVNRGTSDNTIGAAFFVKYFNLYNKINRNVDYEGDIVKLNIWDTAGQVYYLYYKLIGEI